MPDIIGDAIDRLITVELRNRAMNHGIIGRIYDAARTEGGGRPLTARAGEALLAAIKPGDPVLLVCGAGYPPEMPNGESDGPPGVATLARALFWGPKAVPVFVQEAHHAPPVVASSEAAGIMVRDWDLVKSRRFGAARFDAPTRQDEVAVWARDLVARLKPAAIIAVERLGPNENGVVQYSTGYRPDTAVDLAPLFAACAEAGVLSIGIGDNGNEVGFGRIFDFLSDFHPYGRNRSPHPHGGACTTVATDILLPASVSNWGCTGLAAMLAFLMRDPELLQTPEMEGRIIRACLDAGGWEARYCTTRFLVDGMVGETSMSIVQILAEMVRLNLAAPDRGPAH